MDFWTDIAITVLLRVLNKEKTAQPFFSALAKVYVKVEKIAVTSAQLQAEIDRQRTKEGL